MGFPHAAAVDDRSRRQLKAALTTAYHEMQEAHKDMGVASIASHLWHHVPHTCQKAEDLVQELEELDQDLDMDMDEKEGFEAQKLLERLVAEATEVSQGEIDISAYETEIVSKIMVCM